MHRERYMGVSVERVLREVLRRELSDDPEALRLAEEILQAYVTRGRRGVKQLVEAMLEGEPRAGAAEEGGD
ncbi:MAG: hypothetical protein QXT33_06230 [Thermofilum sp.]